MKPSKKNITRNVIAATILGLSLIMTVSASAGNTASGTVRMGVVLVSTIQAEPPAAQTLQFAMGRDASLRINSGNVSTNGQVRELEVVIGPDGIKAVKSGLAAGGSTLQSSQSATTKLVQTTFVAD